jgi:predicted nucleic acid binding AN1-type Zn finger protein
MGQPQTDKVIIIFIFNYIMDTGKCKQCARRQRLVMPCKLCTGKFCSGCIQLELHMCPELPAKKAFELEKLSNANPVVMASKVIKI